jgi:hypothetical protein
MKPIIEFLSRHKNTRYGTLIMAGVLIGLWIGNQYPAENAQLWALPIVSLIAALSALFGGKLATLNWEIKVDEAEKRIPPGMTVVEAVKGDAPQ